MLMAYLTFKYMWGFQMLINSLYVPLKNVLRVLDLFYERHHEYGTTIIVHTCTAFILYFLQPSMHGSNPKRIWKV